PCPPPSTLFPYTTLFRSLMRSGRPRRLDDRCFLEDDVGIGAAQTEGTHPGTAGSSVALFPFDQVGIDEKRTVGEIERGAGPFKIDRKSTRLNSSHDQISY